MTSNWLLGELASIDKLTLPAMAKAMLRTAAIVEDLRRQGSSYEDLKEGLVMAHIRGEL